MTYGLPGLTSNVQGTSVPGLDNVPAGWMIYSGPISPSKYNPLDVFRVQRSANYTGGTPGSVNSGLKVYHSVSPGVANFEWAIVAALDNSAVGGENVGVYSQALKRPGAGPTFSLVTEMRSYGENPASGAVGYELDFFASGADLHANRVLVDFVTGPGNGLGFSPATITYGLRFAATGGVATNCTIDNVMHLGVGTYTNVLKAAAGAVITNGVDISDAKVSGDAFASPGFSVSGTGALKSSSIGYSAGTAGVVVQAASKASNVTLNKPCGIIVMNDAELAAGTSVMFTLFNSAIGFYDIVIVNISGGATSLAYIMQVEEVGGGYCNIVLRNVSAGPLSESVVLSFAVIKGTTE